MREEFIPGLLFVTYRAWKDIQATPKDLRLSWQLRGQRSTVGCSKRKSKGKVSVPAPPRRRHVPSVVFICRFFLLCIVISASDSPGKCSRLIKKSSSASCRATRDAAIIR